MSVAYKAGFMVRREPVRAGMSAQSAKASSIYDCNCSARIDT